jgi:hypothetical protein
MFINPGAKAAALLLPLALAAAAAQGGSCGGRGSANAARNAVTANANATPGTAGGRGVQARPEASPSGGAAQGGGVKTGSWGGEHVRLEVRDDGAEIEFDCAHGRMDRLTTDARGRFSARGVFIRERGGPTTVGEKEDPHPARYEGKVEGDRMTITFYATINGEEMEPITYTLRHGQEAQLYKCL